MRLRRLWMTVLAGAVIAAAITSVAWGDLIAGDLRNDVGGAVQAGVAYTRAGLPASDTAHWWLEAKNDVVGGCNADVAHPVTIHVTSSSPAVNLGSGNIVVSGCGPEGAVSTPAAAGGLAYTLTAAMPLGRTSLRATATGGKSIGGATGTYTSKTLAINVNPRQITGLVAARSGAGSAVTWNDSADHADISGYQIRRRVGASGAYAGWGSPLAEVTGTSFGDPDLAPGQLHCYQLRAIFRQVVNGASVIFPSGQGAESCMVTPPRSGARQMLLELLASMINDLVIAPPSFKTWLVSRVEVLVAGFDPTIASHRLFVCRGLAALNGVFRFESGRRLPVAKATALINQSNAIRTVLGCA